MVMACADLNGTVLRQNINSRNYFLLFVIILQICICKNH